MILGCLRNRVGRARIEDGVRGMESIEWIETFAELLRRVAARPTEVTGVVVGPADAADAPPFQLIADVRRDFPAVPLLGYCPADVTHAEILRRMAVAGVHSILLDSIADGRAFVRAAFETTRRQCAASQVLAQVEPVVPERLRPIVATALRNTSRANSVSSLAREVGVDRKTLVNWCAAEDFMPPRDLLRWSRLLLAAALLNWSGRTVASVALELDYPSDNALRIAIRRQFRVRPAALRRGGVDRAVGAFRAAIAARQAVRPVTAVA